MSAIGGVGRRRHRGRASFLVGWRGGHVGRLVIGPDGLAAGQECEAARSAAEALIHGEAAETPIACLRGESPSLAALGGLASVYRTPRA